MLVGPAVGNGRLTKAEAARKGAEVVDDAGVNTQAHLTRAEHPESVETLTQRVAWCRRFHRAWTESKSGSLTSMESHLCVSNWEFSRRIQDLATLLGVPRLTYADPQMRALLLALLHLAVVTARLCGSGGVRAVMAENLLLKQQLIVLRRAVPERVVA